MEGAYRSCAKRMLVVSHTTRTIYVSDIFGRQIEKSHEPLVG